MSNEIVPNLPNLATSLSTYLTGSNADGILGKVSVQTLKAIIGAIANLSINAATPSTNPGAAVGNRMWVASQPGTYTNFAGIVIGASEAAFLVDTGTTYVKVTIPVDLTNYIQSGQVVDNLTTSTTTVPLSANQGRILNNALGLKVSVDYPVPISTGKNLVNPNDPDYTLNVSFSSTGVIQSNSSPWRITGFIPVKPNTVYYPSYKHVLVYYDANRNQISVESSGRTNQYVTTPSNAAYIRFAAAATSLQLEEGNTGTAFEAFRFVIDKKYSQNIYAKYLDQTVYDGIAADRAAALAPINTKMNSLAEQVDEVSEKTKPFYVSMFNFAPGVGGATNVTFAVPVTGSVGSKTLTASASDITAWGAPASIFPVALKHTDGTYSYAACLSTTSTTIVLDKALTKDVAEVMTGYEHPLGQHLSRYQSRALGDYTFNALKRYAYKNAIIAMANMPLAKQISGQGIKLFSTVDDSLMADLSLIGGAVVGGFSPGGIVQIAQPTNTTIKYCQINQYNFALQQGGAVGKGIQWPVTLGKQNGYIEMYIGTDVAYSGTALVSFEADGVQTFSQSVFGAVQRLNIPFSNCQVGTLKITTETTSDTNIRLGDVIWWQKRSVTGNIFSPTDKVVFLGDSWTQFPAALLPGEVLPHRPDGSTCDGMCFWPERFRTLFAAAGGNPDNILNFGRGGQTSVWGKYWFNTLVKAYNPTHVIVEFFTNDNSSAPNVATHADSVYDFDPVNPWASKTASTGGVFGSCTRDQWLQNIKDICDMAVAAGIKPIVIMPAWTAAAAQANAHSQMNELMIKGM